MAEDSAASKTEQPTAERLREARRKGKTPQSQDFPKVATLFVFLLLIYAMG